MNRLLCSVPYFLDRFSQLLICEKYDTNFHHFGRDTENLAGGGLGGVIEP